MEIARMLRTARAHRLREAVGLNRGRSEWTE